MTESSCGSPQGLEGALGEFLGELKTAKEVRPDFSNPSEPGAQKTKEIVKEQKAPWSYFFTHTGYFLLVTIIFNFLKSLSAIALFA